MAFQELAMTLGFREDTLRQSFSRHNLSIKRPLDIKKFLSQRLSALPLHHAERPQQTAKHLEKWRFVKKVKRVRIDPKLKAKNEAEAEKLRITEEKLATSEAENLALKEDLAREKALIKSKDRKIAALKRAAKKSPLRQSTETPNHCHLGHDPA